MSIYFEEARKLGQLLLTSEEAIQLADANAIYDKDENAKAKMQEYAAYQKNVQESMQQGALPQEEMQTAMKKLTEMATELKQDPVIGALIFAENEFNGFVNKVMNVLKMTITGSSEDEGGCSGCSGGSCSGCN